MSQYTSPQSTPFSPNRISTPFSNRQMSDLSPPIKRVIKFDEKTSVNLTTRFSLSLEDIQSASDSQKLSRQPSFEVKSCLSIEECYLSFDDDDKSNNSNVSNISNNLDTSENSNDNQMITPTN